MNAQSIPPGTMLRSFLTVASGYVLTMMLVAGTLLTVGMLFFPEFREYFELDIPEQKRVMEDNPLQAIPLTMFWSVVAINVAGSIGVGWLTVKTAPFARFQHAIFLAVLLFINFLQIVIQDPPAKKWMDIVYMGALPIAVLYGAKWALDREYAMESNQVNSQLESNNDEDDVDSPQS